MYLICTHHICRQIISLTWNPEVFCEGLIGLKTMLMLIQSEWKQKDQVMVAA